MRRNSGFTLVELIAVIVILGILASVAMPKFVNLGNDADLAATNSVAAALSTAARLNYLQFEARGSMTGLNQGLITGGNECGASTATGLVPTVTWTDGGSTYLNGQSVSVDANTFTIAMPAGWPANKICSGPGSVLVCTITSSKGTSVTANLYCIG